MTVKDYTDSLLAPCHFRGRFCVCVRAELPTQSIFGITSGVVRACVRACVRDACVCASARVRACACVCACVRVRACVLELACQCVLIL